MNIKEILQSALKANAPSIIIAHNHPSGSLSKSKEDKLFTQRMKHIAELMDIKLLDHLILTSEGYTSFSKDREL